MRGLFFVRKIDYIFILVKNTQKFDKKAASPRIYHSVKFWLFRYNANTFALNRSGNGRGKIE